MARWADSTGMISWTKVIFSERIRSIGGILSKKSSMIVSSRKRNRNRRRRFEICSLSDLKLGSAVPWSARGRRVRFLVRQFFSFPLATAIAKRRKICVNWNKRFLNVKSNRKRIWSPTEAMLPCNSIHWSV